MRLSAAPLLLLALSALGCVEFNAECSPPIDEPDYVVTWLSEAVPIERAVVRTRESALGDAIADAYLKAFTTGWTGPMPQAAVENAGAIRELGLCTTRTELPKGELPRRVLREVIPFSNELVVVEVKVKELFGILEHGVSQLAVPGSTPAGQFLQVAGLSYEVDCRQQPEKLNAQGSEVDTEGRRVRTITLGERRIEREQLTDERVRDEKVRLALNDFLAQGGDNFIDLKSKPLARSGRYTYTVVEAALHDRGPSESQPVRLSVDAEKPRIVLRNCE